MTAGQIEALLAPLLQGRALRRIEAVEEGLTNTILRAVAADGESAFLVRIFAGGMAPWEKERRLLSEALSGLPVPKLLLVDEGRGALNYPSFVYQWIEGTTLNAFRRSVAAAELASLAEPLGQLLAKVAQADTGPHSLPLGSPAAPSSLATLVSLSEQRLSSERVRTRLGRRLADALLKSIGCEAQRLPPLGSARCLVHGDLGGRNILIAPGGGSGWRIAGLIDWEDAFVGWASWDVGSLFRYPKRYDRAFQKRFEDGYREGGGTLPHDWWKTVRLLDAMRQLSALDTEEERPLVFADCRELLGLLVRDNG